LAQQVYRVKLDEIAKKEEEIKARIDAGTLPEPVAEMA
jgi:hypothetical protein